MLLHIDGFDSYSVANDLSQEYTSFNIGFSTNMGRYQGGCLSLETYTNYLTWTNPINSMTEIWTGFAFEITSATSIGALVTFVSNVGLEAGVYYSSNDATMYAYNGSVVNSNIVSITLNSWHYLEVHYKMGLLTGVIEAWVDNIQIIDWIGPSTNFKNTQFSSIVIGTQNNDSVYDFNIDDWYVLDTNGTYNITRLGDSRIETLLPISDEGPNDGTPSTAGPHYLMVNEPQWSTSNMITLGNTIGNTEVFNTGVTNIGLLTGNILTVHAVKVLAVAAKTSGGNIFTNTIVTSNSVSMYSNNSPIYTSYSHVYGIYETDPSTTDLWTNTAASSASVGFTIA